MGGECNVELHGTRTAHAAQGEVSDHTSRGDSSARSGGWGPAASHTRGAHTHMRMKQVQAALGHAQGGLATQRMHCGRNHAHNTALTQTAPGIEPARGSHPHWYHTHARERTFMVTKSALVQRRRVTNQMRECLCLSWSNSLPALPRAGLLIGLRLRLAVTKKSISFLRCRAMIR